MSLRIGIVGFGARSALWRDVVVPGNDAVIAAVWDPAERAQRSVAEELPDARIATSLDDLLSSGIDAVMVLSPDFTHAEVAIAALRAGVPVFCEKPLAITAEDADRVLETARVTGTRLYVGHNMRHLPLVRTMRDIVRSGRIGEVKAIWCRHFVGNGGDFYFKDWHADRTKSTGLLLQKGAHDLDVIHWLADSRSETVVGMGGLTVYGDIKDRRDRSEERMGEWISHDNWPPRTLTGLNPVVDVEDVSMMLMQLENGVYASYQQCHFTPDYWRNYTVIGTEGRIENFGDGDGGVIKVWTTRGDYAEPDEIIPIPAAEGGHGGADSALVAEFLRFVREGGPTETSPVAARDAVAAGEAATISLRTDGCSISIPAVAPDIRQYFELQS
ncbi:Gfo/Idh/MocA family oxidoreductase [Diaminobutyricibacter tongyongensis]|uniref:Gfo/Idh/MocA family oxidoreductase n=1 Tax=Leifsonia tongyongensis TaxID=1268043 RepID=A0A6L9XVF4_9MICO|nr:Gfo/Idh/MocA family oxidoreductase [Diaminobutyricibacter tongyongensis]NEN05412.1 Gfo/Idh/MocA family oxidoreductase [Diaminobutyricibacter tongyongensis]